MVIFSDSNEHLPCCLLFHFVTLSLRKTLLSFFAPIFICAFTLFHINFHSNSSTASFNIMLFLLIFFFSSTPVISVVALSKFYLSLYCICFLHSYLCNFIILGPSSNTDASSWFFFQYVFPLGLLFANLHTFIR